MSKKKINNLHETSNKLTKKLSDLSRFFSNKPNTLLGLIRKKSPVKPLKKLGDLITLILIVSIVIGITILIYQKQYSGQYFAGSVLASTHLGGKLPAKAQQIIDKKINKINQDGITINYLDKTFQLIASPIAANPDTAFDFFSIVSREKLQELFSKGRRYDNLLFNLKDQFLLFVFSNNEPIEYYLNEEDVRKLLIDEFSQFERPAKDAQIIVKNNTYNIQHEQHGKIFDYDEIIKQIEGRLAYLDDNPVTLILKTEYPQVYKTQIEPLLPQVEDFLQSAPIKLTIPADIKAKKTEWIINKDELASFISAKKTADQKIIIGLKQNNFQEWLTENVSPQVDREPVNARFKMSGGKVQEFRSSRLGQAVDLEASFNQVEKTLIELNNNPENKNKKIELVIVEVASDINNENVNDLGIKELIGTGYSSFAGSPANRRHNIRTGAAVLNGILIAPDEEFSLTKTLGAIDATSGYLPELVIKGDETVPEYGGGLCQIGTTFFRATLNSGFPITERRNHSYRVSYYEPAGTDATIYDPSPDFKFINDSANHILVQSYITGSDLYFYFWGTDDGRIVTQTKPRIYNITPPPPTKLIETDELDPGEKKCTESAHNGADASFYYKVEYANEEIKEKTFQSHYRPWQEVCLIGKATSTSESLGEEEIKKIFPE